jgi:periplasmic divalent cation tolerance protein
MTSGGKGTSVDQMGADRASVAGAAGAAENHGDRIVLVYATFPSPELAERIGGHLLARRLAACVNILGPVTSLYMWAGERCREVETAALIKTRHGVLAEAVAALRAAHPYENPAVVALAADGGSADFLAWVASETGTSGRAEAAGRPRP